MIRFEMNGNDKGSTAVDAEVIDTIEAELQEQGNPSHSGDENVYYL